MSFLRTRWIAFLRDEQGATAIEYGFVAALVSMTIIVWAAQIGDTVKGFLLTAGDALK